MSFQIHALSPASFERFFAMSDAELHANLARREIVRSCPGTPCRVSLADAAIGERVLLVHHEHQPRGSPYRASHAIYVREGVERARPAPGEVPAVLSSRLISLRAFDAGHLMIDADVLDGEGLAPALERAFENAAVDYVHLHNAKPGCFAASVTRA